MNARRVILFRPKGCIHDASILQLEIQEKMFKRFRGSVLVYQQTLGALGSPAVSFAFFWMIAACTKPRSTKGAQKWSIMQVGRCT